MTIYPLFQEPQPVQKTFSNNLELYSLNISDQGPTIAGQKPHSSGTLDFCAYQRFVSTLEPAEGLLHYPPLDRTTIDRLEDQGLLWFHQDQGGVHFVLVGEHYQPGVMLLNHYFSAFALRHTEMGQKLFEQVIQDCRTRHQAKKLIAFRAHDSWPRRIFFQKLGFNLIGGQANF